MSGRCTCGYDDILVQEIRENLLEITGYDDEYALEAMVESTLEYDDPDCPVHGAPGSGS